MKNPNIWSFLQGAVIVIGIYYLLQVIMDSTTPWLCEHDYLCQPEQQKQALLIAYIVVCFVLGISWSQTKK